jgi:hypothetical protein
MLNFNFFQKKLLKSLEAKKKFLSLQCKQNKKTKIMKATDFKIKTANNGKLFYVCDDYSMYGKYYKTRSGAEKKLEQVLNAFGIESK